MTLAVLIFFGVGFLSVGVAFASKSSFDDGSFIGTALLAIGGVICWLIAVVLVFVKALML